MAQPLSRVGTDAIVRDLHHALMNAPKTHPRAEAELIRELIEAHTALGAYLGAIKQILGGNAAPSQTQQLRAAIDASIDQSIRADEALRHLRSLLLGRRHGDRDRGDD